VFIVNATVICSLCTFTAVPRSTQPCNPPGSLNRVPASAEVKAGNVTSVGCQGTLCDNVTMQTVIHVYFSLLQPHF